MPGAVLRRALKYGVLIGIIDIYLALVGLIEALAGRNLIVGIPVPGSATGEAVTLGAILPLVVAFGAGLLLARASDHETPPSAGAAAGAGLLAGAIGGAVPPLFPLPVLPFP